MTSPPRSHPGAPAEHAAAGRGRGRPSRDETERLDATVRERSLELFLEHGYEGTSMEAIARAAGTTKVSLYARYDSKEALFRDVLDWATRRRDWPIPEVPPPDPDDLEGALRAVADAALRRGLHPEMVKLGRIAVAQAGRFPELARNTDQALAWQRPQYVADLLARHAARGTIIADDPEILAHHFLAMVVGMPARLASLGRVRDPETQARYTEAAVELFLRGLRPDRSDRSD